MCYNAAQTARKLYKEAKRIGASQEELDRLKADVEKHDNIVDYYQVSGFEHPKLFAFSKAAAKIEVERFYWGLIPHWAKDEETALSLWNKTLNARGETIFEKPSFKDAAHSSRCIIPLDGFFEHQHKGKDKFPHFMSNKRGEQLLVGGLTSHWTNNATGELMKTLTIVTTQGNELMSNIHNNPKIAEPRMPLILKSEDTNQWLEGGAEDAKELIKPYSEDDIQAITVQKILGKSTLGNVKDAQKEFFYQELNTLF